MLAAHRAGQGAIELTVEMGESLGSPSSITATVRCTPSGPRVELAGAATVAHVRRLRL
ncbi:hypothetical protein [Streptomyces sp. NBC_00316]|uniref:hypothetical protein n=1 Tax=Streptomyces sp. NBC_00316 TaxID=2975710 RepID=UPI002E2CE004|nr:hypothetical protein [Streptomyces sp. NBC_00316]